jgi:hypothetical protein
MRFRQEDLRCCAQKQSQQTTGDTAMKKTLTLLAATTAICAGISAPVWSTIRADSTVQNNGETPFAALYESGQNAVQVILASSREDDDDDKEYRSGLRERDDDDDTDDECDDDHGGNDDGGDDDDDCGTSLGNAAPAGTVAPPKNGLFGAGAVPQVEVK